MSTETGTMQVLTYQLRFLSPAFLGDAEQSGVWRTPPIKALIRQWWRIAFVNGRRPTELLVDQMRQREAKFFGSASSDGNEGATRSVLRIRLEGPSAWSQGKLKDFPNQNQNLNVQLGKNSVDARLYSGYGPVLTVKGGGVRLKAGAAVQANEAAELRLAVPDAFHEELLTTMHLLHRYGALGGRSRNAWGSFELQSDQTPPPPQPALVNWREAMTEDWAHGIGKDEKGPLIWQTPVRKSWDQALKDLAQLRANVRRKVDKCQALAFPDNKPAMPGWDAKDRVPNSLRFKIRSAPNGYCGVIFHVPCRPSRELWDRLRVPNKANLFMEIFEQAHRYFDSQRQEPLSLARTAF